MKSFLFTVLTVLFFSLLGGCSSNTEQPTVQSDQPAVQATDQPAAQAAEPPVAGQPAEQTVNVKSPSTGTGNTPAQNPGTAGAAKAISPAL